MKIGSKVQLRDQGPIYGITDIERRYDNFYGYVIRVKVDNQWYTREQFEERFKLREDLNG